MYNNKEKIVNHYNLVSPYYYDLWGEHLHHGYWITGEETKEEAQLALTKHLAEVAGIRRGSRILDVGCGFGASSIYLAKEYGAEVIGITISPVQVAVANKKAEEAGVNCKFICMDADHLQVENNFDVVWSIESISHYTDIPQFLRKAASILNPDGTIAIIDWFKKPGLSPVEYKKSIIPIEKGMMVELHTVDDYANVLQSSGLSIVCKENLNEKTAKTWDISLDIIKNKKLWLLALVHGREFINFLKSFRAMKNGFETGNFVYGLLVTKKE